MTRTALRTVAAAAVIMIGSATSASAQRNPSIQARVTIVNSAPRDTLIVEAMSSLQLQTPESLASTLLSGMTTEMTTARRELGGMVVTVSMANASATTRSDAPVLVVTVEYTAS